jgi:hypothetical protein
MKVTVPIYIEEVRVETTPTVFYRAKPLFFSQPEERDLILNHAVTR